MEKIYFKIATGRRVLVLFLTFIFTISFVGAFAQAKKTDYSGTWTFNESKSQLGEGMGRRAPSKLVISQIENVLTFEKTSTRQSGETMTAVEKYNLDGVESDNSSGNRKKKSTVSWSADLKELTIKSTTIFERDGNTMEIKTIEIFKLAGDEISLVIETTSTSDRGESKTSLFYDRAE